MRRLTWYDLAAGVEGASVELDGFIATQDEKRTRGVLLPEPPCCAGCYPRNPLGAVEVLAAAPLPLRGERLRLRGIWRRAPRGADAVRYQLHDAQLCEPAGWGLVRRRGLLTAGPLLCFAPVAAAAADARQVLQVAPAVDMHSHAGGIANVRRVHSSERFADVAGPMRQGGMAAISLAIVSDGPTHRVMADGRLHPFRAPAPGELYDYAQLAFRRVHEMLREQSIAVIIDAGALNAARAGTASAIIAAEGADFLEGRLDRLDEVYRRWSLRHLQLTHYRVNELGDIQTEAPVHDGLTDFGAEVIRRCNTLGVVVDVAHGTYALVKRAAAVTSKPIVLSHTSLTTNPRPFTRLITPDHARVIASTGGVIGVWPPEGIYRSLVAMAAGVARLADVVGVDHVGIGTDMRGLVGASILPNYDQLPELADALLATGFSVADSIKILGENYRRVFTSCVSIT